MYSLDNLTYTVDYLNYISISYTTQSWSVSPIQYLLRTKISIVDAFVSIIKIIKVFVIVSISHK